MRKAVATLAASIAGISVEASHAGGGGGVLGAAVACDQHGGA